MTLATDDKFNNSSLLPGQASLRKSGACLAPEYPGGVASRLRSENHCL